MRAINAVDPLLTFVLNIYTAVFLIFYLHHEVMFLGISVLLVSVCNNSKSDEQIFLKFIMWGGPVQRKIRVLLCVKNILDIKRSHNVFSIILDFYFTLPKTY